MSDSQKPTVIYIAGYSRSGSTILDIMLGNIPGILSVGELGYLANDFELETRTCSCGNVYSECDFWRELKLSINDFSRFSDVLRLVESRSRFSYLVNNFLSQPLIDEYKSFQAKLFNYLSSREQVNFIVDSSKSARDMVGRPIALHTHLGLNVKVIHITKHGYSILESYKKKGSNWSIEGYKKPRMLPVQRAMVGWTLANKYARKYRQLLGRDNYYQLKYEDLVEKPEFVLDELTSFLGVDLSLLKQLIVADGGVEVGHNVGGNRVRQEKNVGLKRNLDAQLYNPSLINKILFKIIAGKELEHLGYLK